MANEKLLLEAIPDKFQDFLSKLDDLTKIHKSVRLKIDSENILMYSMVGEDIPLALKNYLLKTDTYFKITDNGFTLDFIIEDAKKLIKSLQFIKISEKILFSIDYKLSVDNTIAHGSTLKLKNDKLKLQIQGGELSIMKDIDKIKLSKTLNIDNKDWSFSISSELLNNVKRLSSINSDIKIINILVNKSKITFSETSSWELEVGVAEIEDKTIIFNKTYLSCINEESKTVEFLIFPNFLLVRNLDNNLMIAFEQTFE